MPDDAPAHLPVLVDRVTSLLAPALAAPGSVAVDGTVGLGGHALALLRAAPAARLVGVDRDPAALAVTAERLAGAGAAERATLVRATFDDVAAATAAAGTGGADGVDAVLLDLGVSSMQLDEDARGFAYSRDTPLDMRMGAEGPTAADVLNGYPAERLEAVLRDHAQERYARRIARAVVRERARAPFTSSARLVEIVYDSVPAPARRTGGHPAKRVFQALRMEVNDEVGLLRRALPAWLAALRPGGRMAVLSYHSGEDRLVKQAFAAVTEVDVPPGLPVEPPPAPFRRLTRGGEAASAEEAAANPRAAPARLRAVERRAGGAVGRAPAGGGDTGGPGDPGDPADPIGPGRGQDRDGTYDRHGRHGRHGAGEDR